MLVFVNKMFIKILLAYSFYMNSMTIHVNKLTMFKFLSIVKRCKFFTALNTKFIRHLMTFFKTIYVVVKSFLK